MQLVDGKWMPDEICHCCGHTTFWTRADDVRICAVCHPQDDTRTVAPLTDTQLAQLAYIARLGYPAQIRIAPHLVIIGGDAAHWETFIRGASQDQLAMLAQALKQQKGMAA